MENLNLREKIDKSEDLIRKCISKAIQCILLSRVDVLSTQKKINKNFHIETEDSESIQKMIDNIIFARNGIKTLFLIDIHFDENNGMLGFNTIIESWRFNFDPFKEIDTTFELPKLYKNSILFIRALYSLVRNLPSYTVYKNFTKNRSSTSTIKYQIRICDPISITNPSFPLSTSTKTFAFQSITTPMGIMKLDLSFKDNLTKEIASSSKLILDSQFIIKDYNNNQFKDHTPSPQHHIGSTGNNISYTPSQSLPINRPIPITTGVGSGGGVSGGSSGGSGGIGYPHSHSFNRSNTMDNLYSKTPTSGGGSNDSNHNLDYHYLQQQQQQQHVGSGGNNSYSGNNYLNNYNPGNQQPTNPIFIQQNPNTYGNRQSPNNNNNNNYSNSYNNNFNNISNNVNNYVSPSSGLSSSPPFSVNNSNVNNNIGFKQPTSSYGSPPFSNYQQQQQPQTSTGMYIQNNNNNIMQPPPPPIKQINFNPQQNNNNNIQVNPNVQNFQTNTHRVRSVSTPISVPLQQPPVQNPLLIRSNKTPPYHNNSISPNEQNMDYYYQQQSSSSTTNSISNLKNSIGINSKLSQIHGPLLVNDIHRDTIKKGGGVLSSEYSGPSLNQQTIDLEEPVFASSISSPKTIDSEVSEFLKLCKLAPPLKLFEQQQPPLNNNSSNIMISQTLNLTTLDQELYELGNLSILQQQPSRLKTSNPNI